MNRNMRHSQIILLCSILLVLVGCHNNAHLRTQKILKPGEKVYSGSGVLAIGGAEEDWDNIGNTGVMGLRGEVSMLKGSKDSEAGPYFGVGIGDDGPGLILGYDYRKYTGQSSGSIKKLGAQIEVNIGEAGQAFHLRPSITSTTGRGKPFYGGVHGLLAVGNLMDGFEWETYDSSGYHMFEHHEEWIDYRFNSLGAGITAGVEFLAFDNNSIQLQVDVSLVKNSFSTDAEPPDTDMENVNWASWLDDNGNIDEAFESHDDELMPMVTGSIGMSFFKPDPTNKESFEPLPTPGYNTGQTQTQPIFDPETGEKISGTIRFDPDTGERTSSAVRFDPETGLQADAVPSKKELTYGEIVHEAKGAAGRAHNINNHQYCGAGSCLFSWVGVPAAFLYVESGVLSTLNPYDPFYAELNPNQKAVYRGAYKKEEKKLRRKGVYGSQLFCVGVFFLGSMFGGAL